MQNGSYESSSRHSLKISFLDIISATQSTHRYTVYGKCIPPSNISKNNRNSDLTTVANLLFRAGDAEDITITPQIGIPIQIPSIFKAQGCRHACIAISRQDQSCYVETKYDGLRMQIHVDLSLPLDQQVQIFSKSRKNSTKNREEIIL